MKSNPIALHLGTLAGSASALSLEVESTANFVQSTAADLNRGYVELPAATRLTIEGRAMAAVRPCRGKLLPRQHQTDQPSALAV